MKRTLTWIAALGTAWTGAFGYTFLRDRLPTSHWYSAGPMMVEDVVQGECPVLYFDRDISYPFHGSWLVSLRRLGPNGGWVLIPPTWTGEQDYQPDSELPTPLTFGWWVWDDAVVCDWDPGVYRLNTEIRIQAGGATRYARIQSDPFTVWPKEP
jgi:hypothetical protein